MDRVATGGDGCFHDLLDVDVEGLRLHDRARAAFEALFVSLSGIGDGECDAFDAVTVVEDVFGDRVLRRERARQDHADVALLHHYGRLFPLAGFKS